MKDFAVIDIILAVLGCLLILRGFTRGFIKEFFSLGAPVLGVLGSFLLYKNGAAFLRGRYFEDMRYVPEIIAFIAVFLIIFFICKFLQKILNDVIEGLSLQPVDKLLGLVFGILEGIAAVSLVVFVIMVQPLFNPETLIGQSKIADFLIPFIIGLV